MRQKLSRRAANPRDVDPVLERLLARHFLDDRRFALGYARYRSRRRYGRRRIEMELRRRGVAAELIVEALAEVFPEEGDERALVRQRIEKRLERAQKPYDMKLFRSLYASLLRAGFPSAIILDELFARARFGRSGRGAAAQLEGLEEEEG